MKHQQRFDVVTHEAKVDDDAPKARKAATLTYSTRAGINIITNKALPEHAARLKRSEE